MRRFLHILSWRSALAGRLVCEVLRALGRRLVASRVAAAEVLVCSLLLAATVALYLAPNPHPIVDAERGVDSRRAVVVDVDDSGIQRHGLIDFGTQVVSVRLCDDGRELTAYNEIRGQLELDKRFVPGDTALVTVREFKNPDGTVEVSAIAREHWRLGGLATLFGAFALFLLCFGGLTGLRALFTFAFSCLAIWKLMIPWTLKGHSASLASFLTVLVLTAVIIFLVAGISRKGVAAFLGSMLGVLASFGLGHAAVRLLHLNGATMPFAQQLLYSGVPGIDLQDIFIGAIVLASSGAVMDLAMDIAAGVAEVKRHNPALGFRPLLLSGVRIGRSVVGTMTTTLLLAYSGGYLTLLMVFASEGTAPATFLNSTLVSAEVVKTLVGSLGLLLVAPFTALASAAVYRASAKGAKVPKGCNGTFM